MWRRTREYRIWRVRVIRKHGKCAACGSIKHRHAHHKNHATYFPAIRFEESNGICLCRDCHMNFHCNFKRSYRTKCTEYDLNNFFTLIDYFVKVFGKTGE